MRTLFFQQIVDSRFSDKLESELWDELVIRNAQIALDLRARQGVKVYVSDPIKYTWDDGSYQFRSDFYVQKCTRQITWNDIYAIVNKSKAVPYKFRNDIPQLYKAI